MGKLFRHDALALFPEGLSHAENRIHPLKPGAARIALRAEANGRIGICIVPVGLTYAAPGIFRSNVTVRIGDPIEVRPLLQAYGEDRSGTEKSLTDLIYQCLVDLTQHSEQTDPLPRRKNRFPRLVSALLLSPLALYGFLHNALPYYLTRRFVVRYEHEPEMVGTVKILTGAAFFILFYLALITSAVLFWGLPQALLYGATLPISGFITLFYDEHFLKRAS